MPGANGEPAAANKKKEEKAGGGAEKGEGSAEDELATSSVRNWMFVHSALNLVHLTVSTPIRAPFMQALLGGDVRRTATLMSRATAASAAFEFLVNPTLGRLSDRYGRRAFLMISPAASVLFKLMVVAKPCWQTMVLERIFFNSMNTMSGTTATVASLSDLYSGTSLAKNIAVNQTWQGVGVISGPILARALQAAGLDFRRIYAGAAAVAALHFAVVATKLPETLAEEKRREFDWSRPVSNPLLFLKLFTGPRSLATLSLIGAFQCFPEGKNLVDIAQAFLLNDIGFSVDELANFTSGWGVSMLLSGKMTQAMITRLGSGGFTTAANLISAVAFYLWSLKTRAGLWAGLALLSFCQSRLSAVTARSVQIAGDEHGMGRGEYAACFANWRALTVFAAPLVLGRLYVAGRDSGRPGMLFNYVAALCLATEAIHRVGLPRGTLDGTGKAPAPPPKAGEKGLAGAEQRAEQQRMVTKDDDTAREREERRA